MELYDLSSRLLACEPDLRTVVDWGCGTNAGLISKRVRDLPARSLVSVDAWQPYIDRISREPFAAQSRSCVCGEVLAVARDLTVAGLAVTASICLDVVEHMVEVEAREFLALIEDMSSTVLLWIPLGDAPVTRDPDGGGNDYYHTHRSTWTAEMLVAMGYCLEIEEDAHTQMHGHRVDAAWAVKMRRWRNG